jgi:hypothetical protein
MLAQMLCSVRQMSQHADEATHLYAGYRALRCSDYTFGREHPPLAKMLVAIPLLWSNPPVDRAESAVGDYEEEQATRWLYSQENWWHLLMEARAVSSLFAVALCLGLWIAARRMFGRAVAVVSTAALAFEPNILGHGPLLLNNILLASLFLLAVFSFYLWTRQRSVPLLVCTGLLAGLALLTKHSAVLLIPILILLALAEAWLEKNDKKEAAGRTLGNLGAVVAIGVIATATIWCGYGMRYSGGTRGTNGQITSIKSADVQVLQGLHAAHLLPEDYLEGLIEVRSMLAKGSVRIDLLGQRYSVTPWFFFPLTTTIKFTLPFLVMLVMGGAGVFVIGRERRREILFLLVPAVLFLASSMSVQRTAIGIWHVFPLLPFLLIVAAAGCVSLARRYRWVGGALACLFVLHATSSLRAYPNYLSYANELWGGPQNLYKHLPWTDVNQTYWEVSRYMEQHPNTPCWINSDWRVPVDAYRVPCTQMGNHWETELPTRMKGIVFVSSSWLQIDGYSGGPLAPFAAVEPKSRLGGSAMLVYEGEFDTRVAAARALDSTANRLLMEGGHPAEALLPAREAVEMSQSTAATHYKYCLALAINGYIQQGLGECSVALKLAQADPDGQDVAKDVARDMGLMQQLGGTRPPPGTE